MYSVEIASFAGIVFLLYLCIPVRKSPVFSGNFREIKLYRIMYWTLELASWLEDAPWPATKDELIDYANRSGLPEAVLENLQEIEEDDEVFESIEELWPDYPSKEDFLFLEDEY